MTRRQTYNLNDDLIHQERLPPLHTGLAKFHVHGRMSGQIFFDMGEVIAMSATIAGHYRTLCDMYQSLWDREQYVLSLGDFWFPTEGIGHILWQSSESGKQWSVYYRVTVGAFGRQYMEVYQTTGGFNVRKIFQGDCYGDVNQLSEVDAGLAERLIKHYRLYFMV